VISIRLRYLPLEPWVNCGKYEFDPKEVPEVVPAFAELESGGPPAWSLPCRRRRVNGLGTPEGEGPR
jgi:hypothetical protein